MTFCVRHLVVHSRQYGLVTVYPEDGYRRFQLVWFYGGRFHTPSMNKATLTAFLQRVRANGGSFAEDFDWGAMPWLDDFDD